MSARTEMFMILMLHLVRALMFISLVAAEMYNSLFSSASDVRLRNHLHLLKT